MTHPGATVTVAPVATVHAFPPAECRQSVDVFAGWYQYIGRTRYLVAARKPYRHLSGTTVMHHPDAETHIEDLRCAVASCRHCAADLPHGCRPVVQFAATATLLIIGQAPGARVHQTGIPWNDSSGARLREWLGLDEAVFYNPERVAIVPMGFCYPGALKNADRPPRPECAPLWHDRILAALPRIRLTLLVGMHAQARYLATSRAVTLTETVRDAARHFPYFPLPHPSWRSTRWMQKNTWFSEGTLPLLRNRVRESLTTAD